MSPAGETERFFQGRRRCRPRPRRQSGAGYRPLVRAADELSSPAVQEYGAIDIVGREAKGRVLVECGNSELTARVSTTVVLIDTGQPDLHTMKIRAAHLPISLSSGR